MVVAGEHAARVEVVRVCEADPRNDSWVWDRAVGHPGAEMQAWDRTRVVQTPYAPALNPVKRFFQELYRALEGRMYASLVVK
ncbi:MAG: hypothetical protein OXH72_08635 [Caldilineaceae bacterium]|nr:hypothetical protein [Caldilineaceae bacterium]